MSTEPENVRKSSRESFVSRPKCVGTLPEKALNPTSSVCNLVSCPISLPNGPLSVLEFKFKVTRVSLKLYSCFGIRPSSRFASAFKVLNFVIASIWEGRLPPMKLPFKDNLVSNFKLPISVPILPSNRFWLKDKVPRSSSSGRSR